MPVRQGVMSLERIKEFWNRHKKQLIVAIGVACVALVVVFGGLSAYSSYCDAQIEELSYNEFLQLVAQGKVDTVYYNPNKEYMTITLFNNETRNMDVEEREHYHYAAADKRRVLYPAHDDFRKELLEADVAVRVQSDDIDWMDTLMLIATIVLPCVMIYYCYRMVSANFKKTDISTIVQKSDSRFSDIIGHDEILGDIRFLTEMIKNPKIGDDIGAKVPKGILLCGDPGTGKTLIARAIVGEADVPFLYVNGSSLIELFVGMGAKRVRDIFKLAKENAPCIIFIDEIDSVGQARGSQRDNSENEQTINALLQEMDGFTGREGIFIIAATNRENDLDPALVRAGRFDRKIQVSPPRDWKIRCELFRHYLQNFSTSPEIDYENISKQTIGFTGADVAAVCNEASIIAVMQKKTAIDNACVEEAIDKKMFDGNRSKKESFKEDKRIVAYHESGHAVMNYLLDQPMARASIIATTSGVGGFVIRSETDSAFMTDEDMRNSIMVAYAGRASEEIKFHTVTTGAANDITQATRLMLAYIERFGFDKTFGLIDMDELRNRSLLSERAVSDTLTQMSRDMYDRTILLLRQHFDKVELLADRLLEIETMSGDAIKALLSGQTEAPSAAEDFTHAH